MRRTRTVFIAGAALTALLASFSACGGQGDASTFEATGAPREEALARSETPGADDSSPQAEHARRVATNEPIGIVDAKGEPRGTYLPSDVDARDARIAEDMERRGARDSTEVPAEAKDAYLVVEAVEVHDESGQLTGYLTSHFVAVEDYPAEVESARNVLAAAGFA